MPVEIELRRLLTLRLADGASLKVDDGHRWIERCWSLKAMAVVTESLSGVWHSSPPPGPIDFLDRQPIVSRDHAHGAWSDSDAVRQQKADSAPMASVGGRNRNGRMHLAALPPAE